MESLEPPRVVQARCPDMVSKDNLYGQVTVRMHSKQVMIKVLLDRYQQTYCVIDKINRLRSVSAAL